MTWFTLIYIALIGPINSFATLT